MDTNKMKTERYKEKRRPLQTRQTETRCNRKDLLRKKKSVAKRTLDSGLHSQPGVSVINPFQRPISTECGTPLTSLTTHHLPVPLKLDTNEMKTERYKEKRHPLQTRQTETRCNRKDLQRKKKSVAKRTLDSGLHSQPGVSVINPFQRPISTECGTPLTSLTTHHLPVPLKLDTNERKTERYKEKRRPLQTRQTETRCNRKDLQRKKKSVAKRTLDSGLHSQPGVSVINPFQRPISTECGPTSVTTNPLPLPPKMDAKEMKMETTDQCPKVRERHEDEELHSLIYSIGRIGKKSTLNCVNRQTIIDLLMTCPRFKESFIKNVGKECIIVRGKPGSFKAIPPHFPCCLIDREEHLVILYLKPKGNPQRMKSVQHVRPLTTRNDLVVFHVKKRDKILVSNTALTTKHAEFLSVYAYKRETIEGALKRDRRFRTEVFSKLKDINEYDRTTNISSHVVNDLNGKTFKVILDEKKVPQAKQSNNSVPSSCTNTSMTSTGTSYRQQSATNVHTDRPMSEQTARQNTSPTLAKPCSISDTKETLAELREQYPALVKLLLEREGNFKSTDELLRVEYGKSAGSTDMKMIEQLAVRGKSVCQVRVGDRARGTGFLLFFKYILTCAHVIENVFDDGRKQLTQEVTVSFHFKDLGASFGQLDSVPVKSQVVAYEKLRDHSGCHHDWALLEMDADYTGLLSNFVSAASPRGGIRIIGHPDGGVKKSDACFTIPVGDRVKLAGDRYFQHLITKHHFDPSCDLKQLVNQSPDLAYDTCFFFGSSGSPVFDEFCNVVAMHTGGYAYETQGGPRKVQFQGGQTHSLIELAQPLSRILPRLLIHLVCNKRFDVLEEYLEYTSYYRHDSYDQVKEDVKRIVEGEKLYEFEYIIESYDGDSEKIMEFITCLRPFFCSQWTESESSMEM